MHEAHRSSHCQNCGEALSGPYCAACGQKDEPQVPTLGHLAHEALHEVSHLDGRFLGTLRLLLRPGALTLEFLQGRRARWFPPFRLYLLVSLLFFALATVRPSPGEFRISIAAPAAGEAVAVPAPTSRLRQRAEQINADPRPFVAKLFAWLPRVLFVLLPVFALLLKLAYLRQRIPLVAHAVFSLHEHAFAFLVFTGISLLGLVPYVRHLRGLLILLLPWHLVLSLKRVYGQGWALTLAKAVLLGTVHLGLALGVFAATVLGLLLLG